ncbi:hypothetical protein BOTU111921_11320 [Bordetella tumbae]|uniref:DUF2569 family protein n=1 Tax=Bordetella tumbae TaxID=1649139 RepID=UPI0039EE25C9
MRALVPLIGFLAFTAYGIAQLVAGYIGIEYHLGVGWAWAALTVGLVFRFTLPVTIGAFFGAMDVWHWHWVMALVFAAPGLALIVPGVIAAVIGSFRDLFTPSGSSKPARTVQARDVVGPTGVGGWLWLPIVGLMIFRPLGSFGATLRNIDETEKLYPQIIGIPDWSNYKTATWCLVVAGCAISIAAGYRLWKDHKPQSVKLAMFALWLPVITLLLDAISANVFLGLRLNDYFDPQGVGSALGGMIVAALWTWYFKRSRRVRNTYYNRLYPTDDLHGRVTFPERRDPTL